jgi:transposase-like protein
MYTVKNRYYKNSKISEAKFRQLIKHFAMDLSASDTARLIGISVRSVNDIFLKIRTKILSQCDAKSIESDVMMDECFTGTKMISNKQVSCSIFKKTGKIYTTIVSDESYIGIPSAIQQKIPHDSYREYKVGINDSIASERQSHINDVSSFWAYSQYRLTKFKGISRKTFILHLKETEFRFNHRKDDLYKVLLKMIRNNPI